ncbi:hypothetical protein D3C72_2245500 [compost metagenome]
MASSKYARPKRPPPPEEPISRRPFCSAMTVTDKRIRGRTSAARVPSARATSTTSCSAARPAMTCTTRGSLALARRSTFSSNATLAVLSMVPMGSRPG